MSEKDWKAHLLKSGLPFEYEVKECFVKHKCTVWDEYSYVRTDEHDLQKEFSYDLDANYWENNNSVNFMVECKYKTEPTKWFFLPDPYSYQSDLSHNSFLHTIDYFKKKKFPFTSFFYDGIQKPLGPYCLKGVEIYQNQFLETNIFKAINQLSFAFAGQVTSSIDEQLNGMFSGTNFFNVPIIITNAELYIIKEKLKTVDIENSKDITEVAIKNDFLLFHNKTGEALKRHNRSALNTYFNSANRKKFKQHNNSFAKDIDHFIEVVAANYCPEVILIMHHDSAHKNYTRLFDYLDFIMKPTKELETAMEDAVKNREEKHKKFMESLSKKKKT